MPKPEERSLIERWGASAVALTSILTLLFLVFPRLKPEKPQAPTPIPAGPESTRAAPPSQPQLLSQSSESTAVARERRATQSAVPGDIILGTWQQYQLTPGASTLTYLATYVVAKANGVYTMSAREQREGSDVLNSIGIFDVQSNGTTWTFNSNWGGGRVGSFELRKTSNTTFDGTATLENQVVGIHRWVRIQ